LVLRSQRTGSLLMEMSRMASSIASVRRDETTSKLK
jgi:hypothetical protein